MLSLSEFVFLVNWFSSFVLIIPYLFFFYLDFGDYFHIHSYNLSVQKWYQLNIQKFTYRQVKTMWYGEQKNQMKFFELPLIHFAFI
jgi:hypothetical protein